MNMLMNLMASSLAFSAVALRLPWKTVNFSVDSLLPQGLFKVDDNISDFVHDILALGKAFNITVDPGATNGSAIEIRRSPSRKVRPGDVSSVPDCWKGSVERNPRRTGKIVVTPSMIVIASISYGYPEAVRAIVQGNHKRYAEKHGYRYKMIHSSRAEDIADYSKGRKGGWAKISFVKHVFDSEPMADYVFWMDADSLFVDVGRKLEDLAMLSGDFVCSGDGNGINTGHMLIKKSLWSTKLLSESWKICPPPFFRYEQSGFMTVLGGGYADNRDTWKPACQKLMKPLVSLQDTELVMGSLPNSTRPHVTLLPQCTLNANDDAGRQLGVFIWHCAGGHSSDNKSESIKHVNSIISDFDRSQMDSWGLQCIGVWCNLFPRVQDGFRKHVHGRAGSLTSDSNYKC
eukprot:gnl/TRDRNA2_/TRDRNA2_31076_c0_seq1.p1 gnl/TRDRNA2_/TRDRNA2_31076_c0~~gnl/TRDRNA2_/TRDRNA2_31076_c0_seq1.p1  ORF type:complete len:402 (+),score=13.04 gnl/TRDRNA2_/TRDRNA2_31076_c0_seq1:57-1262(+)